MLGSGAHAQCGDQGAGVTIHSVTTPCHALGSYWCDWSARSELPVTRMMWRTDSESCESGFRAEHSSKARMRRSSNIGFIASVAWCEILHTKQSPSGASAGDEEQQRHASSTPALVEPTLYE